ncbi:hypothetical protein PE066_01885 [Ramlibacter tataouinensis]|uniref:hypothetical protein n=1 Tax=Ramlibacter tataouinensis TaxID=94132 RepID=UPI0022F3F9AE|nr:hypothetical protein [Ramlibacter tataouinensis]WBY02304.1 hypothetical protein PE066_01885 [Ramlibacter tataouinensis]
MDSDDIRRQLAEQAQHIDALKDNQFALVAQVQVLQAALASALMHHADRAAVLADFERIMQRAREATPNLAARMEALEAGMRALLGAPRA